MVHGLNGVLVTGTIKAEGSEETWVFEGCRDLWWHASARVPDAGVSSCLNHIHLAGSNKASGSADLCMVNSFHGGGV